MVAGGTDTHIRHTGAVTSTTQFTATQARALTRAVFIIFLLNGMMMGCWGGSLAGLRERVHTDSKGIGIVLVVTGLSAIASMQFGGRISDRLTPRLPSILSGFVIVAGLLVAAFATNFATLIAAGVLMGLGNGIMDVAMNSLGVDAEKASGRAVMSRFHAFFSLGGFLGSALIVGAAHLSSSAHPDPRTSLLVVAALGALALAAMLRLTPVAPHVADDEEASAEAASSKVPTQAYLLGVMALFFGFTEGTAVDWASIHVTDVANVDPGTGAAGLVAVSATMVLIRLSGDILVAKFGRVAVVRFGAPVAVAGFAVVSAISSFGGIIAGWLLVGLGVGMIAPQIYGIAGHLGGGRVLAIVTGCGYTAFLAGPAIIGFASSHFGIQHAMYVPLAAGALLTTMTFTSALHDPTASKEDAA